MEWDNRYTHPIQSFNVVEGILSQQSCLSSVEGHETTTWNNKKTVIRRENVLRSLYVNGKIQMRPSSFPVFIFIWFPILFGT